MNPQLVLSDQAFRQIRAFFHRESGIDLPENKRHLVAGRLRSRVATLKLDSYDAYFELIGQPDQAKERQCLIDRLTTNETFFFREPKHFELLAQSILPSLTQRPLRLWCAAASTGEEPYSLAMLLSDQLGPKGWELVASDLSTQALAAAAQGLYPMQRIELLPADYLKRFCQRGTGEYQGQLLIRRELREKVQLLQHNLMDSAAALGMFDVIFLRNVLIYFNPKSKQQAIDRLVSQLRPGGWLIVSHSESLYGTRSDLQMITPSVYRRPAVQNRICT